MRAVAFSPDGKVLVSGGSDDAVRRWDVATGKLLRTLAGHGKAVNAVAWSPDGKLLASGSEDDTAKLWNAESGLLERSFEGHTGGVKAVSFSRDSRTLATGSTDGTVRLWDVSTGAQTGTMNANAGPVETAVLSPDGRLAVGSLDGEVIEPGTMGHRFGKKRQFSGVGGEWARRSRTGVWWNRPGNGIRYTS